MKVKQSHLAILKTLYAPKVEQADLLMLRNARKRMDEAEAEEFDTLQATVGEVYLQLMEDLDTGLDDLADRFPEETDPRKWNLEDWVTFDLAVFGHKYEELWRTYAKQESNLHLVWKEIEQRVAEQ